MQRNDTTDFLAAALRYAALGYPVFPLRPGEKKPLTKNGFKNATTEEAKIRAWWTKRPNANIGIATGNESGLIVFDVDPAKGGDASLEALEKEYGKLPTTPEVKTGGGGRHFYFRASERGLPCSVRKLGPGLDIRANGGYVVAPPSIHESGNIYLWVEGKSLGSIPLADFPGRLIERLQKAKPARKRKPKTPESGNGQERVIPEGERNSELASIAGGLRSKGFGREAIANALQAINQVSCRPPLPSEEVEKIADSISNYEPGAGIRSRSFASVCKILRDDSLRKEASIGLIEYDEFADAPTIDRKAVGDHHFDELRDRIESNLLVGESKEKKKGAQFTRDDVYRAVHLVAREHPFHPVRDYLRSLRWDGRPRLATELPLWLRLKRDPLQATMVRRWLISAVARPLRPGCKVDYVLTLVGTQGTCKSTFFKVLAGEDWFSDTPVDLGNKDGFLALRRVWILEFAEFEALTRARDANQAKAFLSSTVDKYRPPYGREVVEVKRTCVIVASTNQDAFLTDSTGNRRYWPLRVTGPIDIPSIRANRDQLLAEAVHALDDGEPWHLTNEEEAELAERHREFEVGDPWEEPVLTFASTRPEGVSVADVIERALEKPTGAHNRSDMMRVAEILKSEGFVRKSIRGKRAWVRPTAATSATSTKEGSRGVGEPGKGDGNGESSDEVAEVAAPGLSTAADPDRGDDS